MIWYVGLGVIVAAVLTGAASYWIARDPGQPMADAPFTVSSTPEAVVPVKAEPETVDPEPILLSPTPTVGENGCSSPDGCTTSMVAQASPPDPAFDLGLRVPLTIPACDGSGIIVIHSASSPGNYADEIGAALASNPTAQYLRTDQSCPSLRQQSVEGNPIYAVYKPSGYTAVQLCEDVYRQGGDAYGKWLNTTSDPTLIVPC